MEESTTRKTIKSASTQTIVTIFTVIITLGTFSVLSRLLSKDDFGYFAVISAITAIFTVLSDAGMGSAVIQVKTISRKYVDTAFALSLYLGILFAVLLVLLSDPISRLVSDETISTPLKWMSVSILFFSMNSVLKAGMTRNLQFKKIGIYKILAMICSSALAIASAYFGAGVYAIITQTLATAVFTFIIFYAKLEVKPKWFYVSWKYVKQIFSFGGWLTASVVVRVIYQQLDKLLMSAWVPVSVIGAYNRPAGFINHASNNINGVFDTILFPILSSIQDNVDKIRRAFGKLVYFVSLYSSILCMFFVVGTKAILTIFFGSEWTNLDLVFIILSYSLLIGNNSQIMDCFIRSLAYVKMGFYLRIVAVGITVGCLFVGKNYGLIGYALAMVVSDNLITLSKMWYIGYKIKYSFFRILWDMLRAQKISVIPIICTVAFYDVINQSMLSSILSCVVLGIYFVVMLLFVPGMMGKEMSDIVYSKFPKLRRLLIWNN